MPGHKSKLLKLLDYIKEVMPSLAEDDNVENFTDRSGFSNPSPHERFSTGL